MTESAHHDSVLKDRQEEILRERELEELEVLRSEIEAGDLSERKMERALEITRKYFGLRE